MTKAAPDTTEHSPPSTAHTRSRRNRSLVAVFATTTTLGYVAMIQLLPVVLVPMAADLGTSRAAVAGASTIATLVGALGALPVGRVLDRHGGRTIMAAGSTIGAASVLLWSQVTDIVTLYVAFGLMGSALAMSTYEAAFAVIVVAMEPADRNRAILTVTMFTGLATYLAYPLLGWLDREFGWRTAAVVVAAVLAVVAIPGHLWAIPSRTTHRDRVSTGGGIPFRSAVARPRFWLLVTSFVAQAGSAAAFLLLVVAYFVDRGHSVTVATSVPIAIGVLQVLSRLLLSLAGDRVSIAPVTAAAFTVQGLGLLLLPLVGAALLPALLCVAAVGLGQGIGVIARPTIVADTFGISEFASVLAAITVPIALARAGFPLLAAWLGDWRFLVVSGGLALLAAAALIPVILDTDRGVPTRRGPRR